MQAGQPVLAMVVAAMLVGSAAGASCNLVLGDHEIFLGALSLRKQHHVGS